MAPPGLASGDPDETLTVYGTDMCGFDSHRGHLEVDDEQRAELNTAEEEYQNKLDEFNEKWEEKLA